MSYDGEVVEGGRKLLLGTWNVSGWRSAKIQAVWRELVVDILAVQDTHLAAMPLQWAQSGGALCGRLASRGAITG